MVNAQETAAVALFVGMAAGVTLLLGTAAACAWWSTR